MNAPDLYPACSCGIEACCYPQCPQGRWCQDCGKDLEDAAEPHTKDCSHREVRPRR